MTSMATSEVVFPPAARYTGVDISAGKNVDIVLKDASRWSELADAQFDVVISGNTIEHVCDVYAWFKEMSRILKAGGFFYITAPSGTGNVSGVTVQLHRYPVDCWRFMEDGLRFLVEKVAGLKVLECYCSIKDIVVIGRKE